MIIAILAFALGAVTVAFGCLAALVFTGNL
jgi:hypothetical protein